MYRNLDGDNSNGVNKARKGNRKFCVWIWHFKEEGQGRFY